MDYIQPFFRAALVVAAIIALTRMNGLRSFSKMTSFDFALTVATGSIVGATVQNTELSIWIGLASIAAIFAIQAALSRVRFAWSRYQKVTENEPLLLVQNGKFLEANLAAANVSKNDVYGKLREANALSMRQVHAVVLEPTGDVSVLHGEPNEGSLEDEILTGVRRK